jgi:hypothetical protein
MDNFNSDIDWIANKIAGKPNDNNTKMEFLSYVNDLKYKIIHYFENSINIDDIKFVELDEFKINPADLYTACLIYKFRPFSTNVNKKDYIDFIGGIRVRKIEEINKYACANFDNFSIKYYHPYQLTKFERDLIDINDIDFYNTIDKGRFLNEWLFYYRFPFTTKCEVYLLSDYKDIGFYCKGFCDLIVIDILTDVEKFKKFKETWDYKIIEFHNNLNF